MRPHRLIAAVATLAMPFPALAQAANDAFECKLPYRQTMEAIASLKMIRQGQPIDMVIVKTTSVEFDPGATRVFGQAPVKAWLVMSERKEGDPVGMSFQAEFPRNAAMESALLSAVKWKSPCARELGICHREIDPPGTGKLDLRLDLDSLSLECRFEVREEDVQ